MRDELQLRYVYVFLKSQNAYYDQVCSRNAAYFPRSIVSRNVSDHTTNINILSSPFLSDKHEDIYCNTNGDAPQNPLSLGAHAQRMRKSRPYLQRFTSGVWREGEHPGRNKRCGRGALRRAKDESEPRSSPSKCRLPSSFDVRMGSMACGMVRFSRRRKGKHWAAAVLNDGC